ncbi:serine hydrolase [Paenibacillus sp. FSL R5-0912]|uniref:serine hydrolase domain-containing protein n=1 Tax=Paenibacillus sp. FSL R5-0912 TaxID=1536771 RepID=UPI0004F5D92D|nr:serine hydrolase [Paenibacillus sp. FSL R5-0912]AIQ43357.1 beta-lactamase [Paenibacillus sp. FSL R5-0912]
MTDIARDLPENHGLSSQALSRFFMEVREQGLEVNSFMLLQGGKVTAEFTRMPYRLGTPQLLYSLSKSFTSIAAGIAWDEGLLKLEDSVISFFPDKLPEVVTPNLVHMTVHHLLSMNAGHHCDIYPAVVKEQDWITAFLAQQVEHEPGSYYRYSTPSSYMLAAIIERVTGQKMTDYLMPRLFEPLDIPRPSWETCPLGITAGGMGLSLSTESIAKFGQMLLDKGIYNGRRIVSAQYIERAASEQSDNRAGVERIDSAQGYGYQFHLCRRGCYRGDGSFGQLCLVAPEQNIVIAATASFGNMSRLQVLLDLVFEYIFDALGPALLPDSGHQASLQKLLSDWSTSALPVLQPAFPGKWPVTGFGGTYLISDNPHGLKRITFTVKNKLKITLQMVYGDERDNVLPFDLTKPVCTEDVFYKDLALHRQQVITYASWLAEETLKLTLYYIETPYMVTYIIGFTDDQLLVRFNINVSLNISEYSAAGNRDVNTPFINC